MADLVNRALSKVSQYQDAPNAKVDRVNWRPLKDVHEELEGLPEIPGHVHDFGDFMHKMAAKAAGPGLSGRDLIKAYAITRASIRRKERNADLVRADGLDLPQSVGKMIRPEGAMAEWLKSPMGQRFLDAAEDGRVDQEAVDHAQRAMKPFGFETESHALPWAVKNLVGKHELVSNLVKAGLSGDSPVKPWRDFATNLYGIKDAKAGFVGSLLGRGDLPTLDARQVILNTGMPTKAVGSKLSGPAGAPAVDRLAARQAAMNPKLDPGMEPFRQHLTHHAVWDKAENATTTHGDIMDTMRHANAGGRIGKGGGGPMSDDERKHQMLIHAIAAMGGDHGLDEVTHPELVKHLRSGSTQDIVRRALEFAKTAGFKRTGAAMLQRDPDLARRLPKLTEINPETNSNLIVPFKDMEADFVNKGNLAPWKEFDVEKANREKAMLVPFVGDSTPANTILRSVNGVPTGDVDQQGGGDYSRSEFAMDEKNATGWRSRYRMARTMQDKIDEYGKEGPVYGLHVRMGLNSADSTHMLLHTMINQINHLPISNSAIQKFDAWAEKTFRQSKQFPMAWPGLRNTQEVHHFFYNNGSNGNYRPGSHVSKFVSQMDNATWQKEGFPNLAAARFANAHPGLLGQFPLATGYSATKLKPGAELVGNTAQRSHGTYDGGLQTEGYAGGFSAPVHASEIWHKDYEGLPQKDPENFTDYSLPANIAKFQQTLATRFPAARMSNRIADAIQKAKETALPFERKSGGRAQSADAPKPKGGKAKNGKNIERAMNLTSLYSLGHDRDAG